MFALSGASSFPSPDHVKLTQLENWHLSSQFIAAQMTEAFDFQCPTRERYAYRQHRHLRRALGAFRSQTDSSGIAKIRLDKG